MKYQIEDKTTGEAKIQAFNTMPSQQIVQESSDIADVLKELNTDVLDDQSFSSIDTKTRLNQTDVSAIVMIDGLVALRFLPREVSVITRSKKRLNISLNGQGRQEIVQIANGVLEQKRGFGERLSNMFSNKA
jgi:hypothetical protein